MITQGHRFSCPLQVVLNAAVSETYSKDHTLQTTLSSLSASPFLFLEHIPPLQYRPCQKRSTAFLKLGKQTSNAAVSKTSMKSKLFGNTHPRIHAPQQAPSMHKTSGISTPLFLPSFFSSISLPPIPPLPKEGHRLPEAWQADINAAVSKTSMKSKLFGNTPPPAFMHPNRLPACTKPQAYPPCSSYPPFSRAYPSPPISPLPKEEHRFPEHWQADINAAVSKTSMKSKLFGNTHPRIHAPQQAPSMHKTSGISTPLFLPSFFSSISLPPIPPLPKEGHRFPEHWQADIQRSRFRRFE